MVLNILLILAAPIALVLLLGAMRSKSFKLERSTVINAPAEKIFPFLDDFRHWGSWSPWEKLDPALQRKFSGAATGVGAVYDWVGNKKVGQGRMEILESVPSTRLRIQLDFIAPIEANNFALFTLAPQGGGTRVVWEMTGARPYMMRVMSVLFNFDKLIGKDFDAGLANLKQIAEA
ncbi:MAG: SRPBCC family protein [Gemmatimonadales bacterium]